MEQEEKYPQTDIKMNRKKSGKRESDPLREMKKTESEKGMEQEYHRLNQIFHIFNEEFFDNQIKKPVLFITTQKKMISISEGDHWTKSLKRNSAYNKSLETKEEQRQEDQHRGIHLSSKILNCSFEEICIILLDAMIQLFDEQQFDEFKENMQEGQKESDYKKLVNRSGTYYSKKYARECERHGLIVTEIMIKDKEGKDTGKHQYTLSAGEKFREVFKRRRLAKYEISLKQTEKAKIEQKQSRVQSSKLFYCPVCRLKIRATRKGNLKIKCFQTLECAEQGGVEFIREENID